MKETVKSRKTKKKKFRLHINNFSSDFHQMSAPLNIQPVAFLFLYKKILKKEKNKEKLRTQYMQKINIKNMVQHVKPINV